MPYPESVTVTILGGWMVAYHEAAHYLAAKGAGYTPSCVYIDQIIFDGHTHNPACMLKYTLMQDKDDIERRMVVLFAGMVCEIYVEQTIDDHLVDKKIPVDREFADKVKMIKLLLSFTSACSGGTNDIKQFQETIVPLFPTESELNEATRSAFMSAYMYVSTNFKQITLLAKGLMERRFLTDEEAYAIVGEFHLTVHPGRFYKNGKLSL